MPFGILVKIVAAKRFFDPKPNGAWSVATVSINPACSPSQSTAWLSRSRSGGDMTYLAPSKSRRSASVQSSRRYWIRVSTRTLTPRAGGQGLLECFLATQVHDVNLRAGELGKGHQVAHAFGFHDRRAALVVRLRPAHPGGEGFVLALAIRVSFWQWAAPATPSSRARDSARYSSGSSMPNAPLYARKFEGGDALRDDLAQLRGLGVVKARHAQVKGIFAGRASGALSTPHPEPLGRRGVARGAAHVKDRRGAADQRGPTGGLVVVLGERPHGRQVNVRVRVDEPGEHMFARGVDDLRPRGCGEAAVDAGDRLAFAEDVREVMLAGGDDFTVFDERSRGSRVAL